MGATGRRHSPKVDDLDAPIAQRKLRDDAAIVDFFTEISFAAMIASLASRWRRKRITKSFRMVEAATRFFAFGQEELTVPGGRKAGRAVRGLAISTHQNRLKTISPSGLEVFQNQQRNKHLKSKQVVPTNCIGRHLRVACAGMFLCCLSPS